MIPDGFDLYSYNLNDVETIATNLKKIYSIKQAAIFGSSISPDIESEVYWVNKDFNTPVIFPDPGNHFGEDWVVIYPEVTFGNPLRAKNVVRWLLHNPGFHTGKIYYGANELHIAYSSAISKFQFPGSKTSSLTLEVIDIPLKFYYPPEPYQSRSGIAYCIRKGKRSDLTYDLDHAILIDGKSHLEISEILRSVEVFISFDPLTLYSSLAVLCGCPSVVIPLDDMDEEEWQPDERRRHGIAYGFERINESRSTAPLALEGLLSIENDSKKAVKEFVIEVNEFFC
jgi:hypothetical protein